MVKWVFPTVKPSFYNFSIISGVRFFLSIAKLPSVLLNLVYGEKTLRVFSNAYWMYLNDTDSYFSIPRVKMTLNY